MTNCTIYVRNYVHTTYLHMLISKKYPFHQMKLNNETKHFSKVQVMINAICVSVHLMFISHIICPSYICAFYLQDVPFSLEEMLISCTQKLLVNLQDISHFIYISYHRKFQHFFDISRYSIGHNFLYHSCTQDI